MEILFPDEYELAPLTVTPLLGPLYVHGLILLLAILVWMRELYLGFIQQKIQSRMIFTKQNWRLKTGVNAHLVSQAPGGAQDEADVAITSSSGVWIPKFDSTLEIQAPGQVEQFCYI